MALAEDFAGAQTRVRSLSRTPDASELLELYSLYKQGSSGDVQGSRPGMLDFKGRAKHDAWSGKKGIAALLPYSLLTRPFSTNCSILQLISLGRSCRVLRASQTCKVGRPLNPQSSVGAVGGASHRGRATRGRELRRAGNVGLVGVPADVGTDKSRKREIVKGHSVAAIACYHIACVPRLE